MSWQADIGKLHSRAKALGVELIDFDKEVSDDDGWYTEENVLTFMEELLEDIENRKGVIE
ncbi:hypothetical protein VP249E411_P0217 [Vibrio phage 249E41-1]|nr:hypothetical protein VP249E411_P0217 [Vibrio phage 249E41-1]CAH9017442.1 hypothetical protein VP193E371_P0220 [Vibrio phage 193E37-1]